MNQPYPDDQKWLKLSDSAALYSYSVNHPKFFNLRMVCLRLKNGGLVVYSPIADVNAAALEALSQMGQVVGLVAPNHYHNLGIAPYLNLYPGVKLYAAQQAIPRLERVTGQTFLDCDLLNHELAEGCQFHAPLGLKTGELWFTVREASGKTILVTCDSFFNMPSQPKGALGWILRLTGGAPGLRVSKVFRIIAQKNRMAYRAWMAEHFESFPPSTLVPSHGAILNDPNLAQRLLDLV